MDRGPCRRRGRGAGAAQRTLSSRGAPRVSSAARHRLKTRLEHAVYRRAERFIVLSHAFAAAFCRDCGIVSGDGAHRPRSVDAARFRTTVPRDAARAVFWEDRRYLSGSRGWRSGRTTNPTSICSCGRTTPTPTMGSRPSSPTANRVNGPRSFQEWSTEWRISLSARAAARRGSADKRRQSSLRRNLHSG